MCYVTISCLGSGEHFRILRSAFKSFHLDQLNIEKTLKENGVGVQGEPPGYHFRDDALILWGRIKDFVGKVLTYFYDSDQVSHATVGQIRLNIVSILKEWKYPVRFGLSFGQF